MWSDRPPSRPTRGGEESSIAEAADQLRYIRDVMARSDAFTAIPGRGSMAMGGLALVATFVLAPYAYDGFWLWGWLGVAVLACLSGTIALVRKAQIHRVPLGSGSGRKFLLGLAPAVAGGVLMTIVLWQADAVQLLPGAWMLLYGVGVLASGAFSVRLVPLIGLLFMIGSVPAFFLPGTTPHWVFGGAFSLFHLSFGYLIARQYGG